MGEEYSDEGEGGEYIIRVVIANYPRFEEEAGVKLTDFIIRRIRGPASGEGLSVL